MALSPVPPLSWKAGLLEPLWEFPATFSTIRLLATAAHSWYPILTPAAEVTHPWSLAVVCPVPFAHAASISQTQEKGVTGSELKALPIRSAPACGSQSSWEDKMVKSDGCLDFSLNYPTGPKEHWVREGPWKSS